jgi:hypothetical protein
LGQFEQVSFALVFAFWVLLRLAFFLQVSPQYWDLPLGFFLHPLAAQTDFTSWLPADDIRCPRVGSISELLVQLLLQVIGLGLDDKLA